MARNIFISINKEAEDLGEEILLGVNLKSFEVSPQTIEPFEEAQLSWVVTVSGPKDKVTVQLNGATVAPTGSATVNPVNTQQYELKALALGASKSLGRVTIVVNHDNCFQGSILESQIQSAVQDQLQSIIQPGAEIQFRDPARVTVHFGRIDMHLPLKIIINNFFDADLDMTLKFSLGLTSSRTVRARLTDVDADAKFALGQHLVSLGSASLIQAIVQVMARAFVRSFLGPALAADLAGSLQELIDFFCGLAGHKGDRLVSISASDGLFQFVCCGLSHGGRFSDVLLPPAVLT
jgi:hypothetical protein